MGHDLRTLLGPDGVAKTADLARRADPHTIGEWVARGRLVRAHRGVVAMPDSLDHWSTRALAGVLATGGALSHTSALTVWRLLPEADPIHLSVPAPRRARRSPGLVVHRAKILPVDRLGPFPVTDLPRALVDTWGLAFGGDRPLRRLAEQARGAVITTLRDRRVTYRQLRAELAGRPTLAGRATLGELIGLVEGGCQSELEIWGVRHILTTSGMPPFVQQHRVRTPSGTFRLDAALLDLKIAVELDGAAFHGSREARERDIRRDTALAAQGWVVLRFSYHRLTTDPDGCRREILAVCRARAALLRR
jgi:hypothetical protein